MVNEVLIKAENLRKCYLIRENIFDKGRKVNVVDDEIVYIEGNISVAF